MAIILISYATLMYCTCPVDLTNDISNNKVCLGAFAKISDSMIREYKSDFGSKS